MSSMTALVLVLFRLARRPRSMPSTMLYSNSDKFWLASRDGLTSLTTSPSTQSTPTSRACPVLSMPQMKNRWVSLS